MARPLTSSDLYGNRPYWLVDIAAPFDGGRIYRFANDAIEISDTIGVFYYEVGLADISVDYALGDGSPQTMQLEISSGTDWPEEFSTLGFPYGLNVTVRRYYAGSSRNSAPIIIRGIISDLTYGGQGEPLRITVEQSPWDSADQIPSPDERVSYQTWADPYEYHLGQYYPIVIGQPGIFTSPLGSSVAAQVIPVIQGKKVAASQMRGILAGHRIDATQVYIKQGSNVALFSVSEEIDQLGNLVSYVGGTSGSVTMLRNEEAFWWSVSGASEYGLVDKFGETVTGAGHAIAVLMDYTRSFNVNSQRAYSERALLDHIKVHFFINDSTTPFEFIQANLAPVLPISWSYDHQGAYWRAWRDAPIATDAVGDLSTERHEITRASSVSVGSLSDVYNRFILRFNQNYRTQAGETVAELTAGDPINYESALCKFSQDRFGQRVWEQTTSVIQDLPSAYAVLQAMARRYAIPKRYVSYVGGLELERYTVGDILTITDPEIGLDASLASVEAVSLSLTEVALKLMIHDRPTLTGRATQ